MTTARVDEISGWMTRSQRLERVQAFVLIEVVLSMTILAIAGTVLMRSLMNSMDATRIVRDTAKAVFLAQDKMHEFELKYSNKVAAELGEFRGIFEQPGASKFYWRAIVERDRDRDAYVITVWTNWGEETTKHRHRLARYAEPSGFMVRTLVPVGRINEDLVRGMKITPRERGNSRYENRRG